MCCQVFHFGVRDIWGKVLETKYDEETWRDRITMSKEKTWIDNLIKYRYESDCYNSTKQPAKVGYVRHVPAILFDHYHWCMLCGPMEEDGATIQPKSFWLGRVCHLVYVMVAIPWKGFLDLWFADHAMQYSWDGYSLLYKPPRHSTKELFGRNYPHLASEN